MARSMPAARRPSHSPPSRLRGPTAAAALALATCGTALTDDPRLTARVEGVHHQPRHIVFDSTARLPLDSQLVAQARETPLYVIVSRAAPWMSRPSVR